MGGALRPSTQKGPSHADQKSARRIKSIDHGPTRSPRVRRGLVHQLPTSALGERLPHSLMDARDYGPNQLERVAI